MPNEKDDVEDRNVKVSNVKKAIQDEANRIATAKEIDAATAYRKQLEEARQREDQDKLIKLKKEGITYDREGHEITQWKRLEDKVEEVIHSEQHAYNDWRSAMMSLLSLYSLFVDAAHHSLEVAMSPVTTMMKQTLRDKFLVPLKDKVLDFARGNPRVDLPALVQNVTFNDDNKLVLGVLSRSNDGVQLEGESRQGLKTLVSLWLHDVGYEPSEKPNEYVSIEEPRVVLTKDRFNELKNSSVNSLSGFLEKSIELEVRSSPSP